MQIITRFKANYPFRLSTNATTYVEILKENLSQSQIHTYQLKCILLKEISSVHLIKLAKIYREENNIMFLYEYHNTSVAGYVSALPKNTALNRYRELFRCFRSHLDSIVQILVHFQIKVDLLIENLAAVETGDESFALKLFVQPDAEFMALRLPMKRHDQIRAKISENRTELLNFYSLEKKRLQMQFQELLETTFGKLEQTDRNNPNFIINGSKLVFIHSDVATRINTANQKGSVSVEKMDFVRLPEKDKINSTKLSNHQRTSLKDKYQNKIKQIQNNLKDIEAHKQQRQSLHAKIFKVEAGRGNQISLHRQQANNDLCEKQRERTLQIEESTQRNKNRMRLSHSREKNKIKNKNKNKEFSDLSVTHSKTADSFHRPQKYKMKIITSHDIEVEKLQNTEQEQVDGLQAGSAKKILSNVENSALNALPLPRVARDLQNQHQNQQQDDSILRSRNSDLGPTTLRQFDVSVPFPKESNTLNQQPSNFQILNQNYIRAFQQQNCVCRPMKMRKSQQFCDRFRQVKSKAEQLLRQYAVCRKQQRAGLCE